MRVGVLSAVLVMGGANWWAVRGQTAQLELLRQQLHAHQEEAAAAPRFQPAPTVQQVPTQCVLTSEELARIVQALAERQPPPHREEALRTLPPPDRAEQEGRFEEATALVDASLASGVLRRDDVFALRRLHAGLGPSPEYLAQLSRLVLAINAQQLVPEDPDHPLP